MSQIEKLTIEILPGIWRKTLVIDGKEIISNGVIDEYGAQEESEVQDKIGEVDDTENSTLYDEYLNIEVYGFCKEMTEFNKRKGGCK